MTHATINVLDRVRTAGVILFAAGLFWLAVGVNQANLRTPFVILGGILLLVGAAILLLAWKR
ncbi:MAG: hypothetical protein MSG64_06235 [Pyrinomonadaceae bacterium MAG19_C2-C3]|nr:hypothetical protein [Pyrinomonadaceae bacterium MAG19_C2-C3]